MKTISIFIICIVFIFGCSEPDDSKSSDLNNPLNNPEGPVIDTQKPAVPTNMAIYYVFSKQVTLTWDAATDNIAVTGYILYRDGIALDTTTNTHYTDKNLAPGTKYLYQVMAVDAAGNQSALCDAINITTSEEQSGVIGDFRANVSSYRSVILEWDDKSEELESYIIERSTDGDFENNVDKYTIDYSDPKPSTPENENFLIDRVGESLEFFGDYQKVLSGQTYYYRIQAYNDELNFKSDWFYSLPVNIPDEGLYVDKKDQIRILFIGNSGIGFNHHIQNWLLQIDSLFPEKMIIEVENRHKGNATLKLQWQDCIDYPESDWKSAQGILFNHGKEYFDYMVVQQFGIREMEENDDGEKVNSLEECRFWKYLNNFKKLADEYKTELVLFQYKVNSKEVTPLYLDRYKMVTSYTETAADKLGIKIVNGARGAHRISFEEGHSYKDLNIRMQISDGHPTQNCSYLFACLLYSCLTGRNVGDASFPVGMTSFAVGEYGLSDETADIIEKAAWEIHNEYD